MSADGQAAVPHPVADAWRDEHAIYTASARNIVLSAPLRAFFEDAHSAGKRPVLTTHPDAWLSWFAVDALRSAVGTWLLRDPSGRLLHTATGQPVTNFPTPPGHLAASGSGRMPAFNAPAANPAATGGWFFDAHMRQRADDRTRIGRVAEAIVTALGPDRGVAALTRMGLDEPLNTAWDPELLTASARHQMPRSERFLAAGPGGALASMSVVRAKTDLREHVRGVVPGGPLHAPDPEGITQAAQVLAEGMRPNIAVFSWGRLDPLPGTGMWGQSAGPREIDVPLGILLGPPAVGDLQLDPEQLGKRHDVTPLGLRRAPSLLVRFTGRTPLWHQLLAFAHDLDRERIAIALGLSAEPDAERKNKSRAKHAG